MNKVTKSKSGFTIIEVVLVLAIAGLIFLIVFLAVPALQRSQRDTQRRSDLSRFMAQVSNYQSNSRGVVPDATAAAITATGTGFVAKYLNVGGDTFADPRGSNYTYAFGAGTPAVGAIQYATAARCAADGSVTTTVTPTPTARQVAAAIGLEGGGSYCQQN